MRDDKEKVMEILFALFEKHQYYNIKVNEQVKLLYALSCKILKDNFRNYAIGYLDG